MSISTRSSKEKELFFSDPTRLERSIRKEKCTALFDTNSSSLIDTCEGATIDTSTRASFDTIPRADNMVAALVLIRDRNGGLHDPEGHLCNAACQKINGHGDEPSVATEDAKVVNYFNEAVFQNYDQMMESMMEQELENQQKRIADFDLKLDFIEKELNGKIKIMAAHVKMLTTQIFQVPKDISFEDVYHKYRLGNFFRERRETDKDTELLFNKPGFPNALCETGSTVSIMAKDTTEMLGFMVEPSQDSFTFVNNSRANSSDMIRNVKVEIGECTVPVDFYVLQIKSCWKSSLLFGRSFMATVGAVCDLKKKKMCLTNVDKSVFYDHVEKNNRDEVCCKGGLQPFTKVRIQCDPELRGKGKASERSLINSNVPSGVLQKMPTAFNQGQSATNSQADPKVDIPASTDDWPTLVETTSDEHRKTLITYGRFSLRFGEMINSPSEIDWNSVGVKIGYDGIVGNPGNVLFGKER
ncbi:hypothetical protein DY000_02021465 [Brassica cretica]|uniref:Uncharacterized protein n=1 Tax=Brassica cretica TaxID=69181 RepID=A0ABQ7ECK2_BRACR|nr:hypothetical protein DY000_02021465 [Brassica cretica]